MENKTRLHRVLLFGMNPEGRAAKVFMCIGGVIYAIVVVTLIFWGLISLFDYGMPWTGSGYVWEEDDTLKVTVISLRKSNGYYAEYEKYYYDDSSYEYRLVFSAKGPIVEYSGRRYIGTRYIPSPDLSIKVNGKYEKNDKVMNLYLFTGKFYDKYTISPELLEWENGGEEPE